MSLAFCWLLKNVAETIILQCADRRKSIPAANGSGQLSLWLGEPSKPEPHLNGIDARIWPRYSGVGNMQVANLCAPIIFAAQKVNAESAGGSEIHVRRTLRHFYIGKKCSAPDIYVRYDASVRSKIPCKGKGIDAETVCRIGALRHEKKWNDVHGIFKAAAQKARPMSIRQNPTITCANIEHAVARLTPIRPMPSARPDLQLTAAFQRPILRAQSAGAG